MAKENRHQIINRLEPDKPPKPNLWQGIARKQPSELQAGAIGWAVILLIGLPLVMMVTPYLIAIALMTGAVGGTAMINGIRSLFK